MPSAETLRVAVLGAAGRMGRTICEAVASAEGLELALALDPGFDLGAEPPAGVSISSTLDALADYGVDVAVDFTVASAAEANLRALADLGVHGVCGTTGLSREAIEELSRRFGSADGPNCVLAPNFAISAVLMSYLASIAAPHFEGIEIIELHHEHKRDAPSGTALATARAIESARNAAGAGALVADPTTEVALPGARGGRTEGGIEVHSVRLPGLVAHQEVLLGTTGQSLSIRQDSYDRTSFMPGVLLAIRKVATTPGLTIGLEGLLGL